MESRLKHGVILTASFLVVACATSGANAVRKSTFVAPQLINTPAFVPDSPPSVRHANSDVTVEVWIDERGVPDMGTYRAVGPGANDIDAAIRQWIGTAHFKPATQDGNPVRAKFGMEVRSQIESR
jgi:hypothetical protein